VVTSAETIKARAPILLFDGECGVCRHIAQWIRSSAERSERTNRVERPIGDDPEALRLLNPTLDIWDAYATVHVIMPDGSMKLGGEAVAEVLRDLPSTRWFAGLFSFESFGSRRFQAMLDVAYAFLSAVRPLFGCESCSTPNVFIGTLEHLIARIASWCSDGHRPILRHNFRSATGRRSR
jgi:predicted DCC family thiol-disulfide oxidoreductase YuxK